MSELQSTIEFSVELYKFYNIDLFQRGIYQIRCSLRVAAKLDTEVEVTTPEVTTGFGSAIVLGNFGACQPFKIFYRNEEVLLKDVVLFRCHLLVDGHHLRESLDRADFSLIVDLWFSDTTLNAMSLVSSRTLQFNFSPIDGLHYHLPVVFDYFHLSAVSITIHAFLTALVRPFMKKGLLRIVQSCAPRSSKSWSKIRSSHYSSPFNDPVLQSQVSSSSSSSNHKFNHRINHPSSEILNIEAYKILFESNTSLKNIIKEYKTLLLQLHEEVVSDNYNTSIVKYNEYDSTKLLNKHLPKSPISSSSQLDELCNANIKLWNFFLLTFSCKIAIQQYLSNKHHTLRVKRFAELFFTTRNSRNSALNCYETKYQQHLVVSELLKRSKYMQLLPPLPVHCSFLDGDSATMPIIFEDQYQDPPNIYISKPIIKRSQTASEQSTTCPCGLDVWEPRNVPTDFPQWFSNTVPSRHSSKSLDYLQKTASNSFHISMTNIISKNSFSVHEKHDKKNCDCSVESFEPVCYASNKRYKLQQNEEVGKNILRSASMVIFSPIKQLQLFGTGSTNDYLRKVRSASCISRKQLYLTQTIAESLPNLKKIDNGINARISSSDSVSSTTEQSGWVSSSSSISSSTEEEEMSKISAIDVKLDKIQKELTRLSEASQSLVGTQDQIKKSKFENDQIFKSTTLLPPKQFRDFVSSPSSAYPDEDIDLEELKTINAVDNLLYHVIDDPFLHPKPSSQLRTTTFHTSAGEFLKIHHTKAKQEFKSQLNFQGILYSDLNSFATKIPYFHIADEFRIFSPEGMHLIICVHGLDGNAADLRLVKTYLELGLPGVHLEFLMSERNQGDTFSNFDIMTDRLVSEILHYLDITSIRPTRISFVGHSLGNIIIRSALTRPQLKFILPRLHTFLSLSGPHLGTLYNSSGLVNMGMWFMQKWKKSGSLLQLCLKDASDPRRSFLYNLSQKSNLHYFKNILLCGSGQDRYVPLHSARIELCKESIKDSSEQGMIYRKMVHNIMQPIVDRKDVKLLRYDVHHALPNTANALIGRAAHIAVLDSEIFIEKFMVVVGLKYFR